MTERPRPAVVVVVVDVAVDVVYFVRFVALTDAAILGQGSEDWKESATTTMEAIINSVVVVGCIIGEDGMIAVGCLGSGD